MACFCYSQYPVLITGIMYVAWCIDYIPNIYPCHYWLYPPVLWPRSASTHLYFGPVLPLPTCTLAPFCLYPPVLWPRSASTHLYFGPVLPLPTCTLAPFCLYPPVLWPRSASTHLYFGPVLPLPTCTLAPFCLYPPVLWSHSLRRVAPTTRHPPSQSCDSYPPPRLSRGPRVSHICPLPRSLTPHCTPAGTGSRNP